MGVETSVMFLGILSEIETDLLLNTFPVAGLLKGYDMGIIMSVFKN